MYQTGAVAAHPLFTAVYGLNLRYNLAYINRNVYQGDNGRVVGYDNAHGFHHRHFMGVVEPIDFTTFEDLEERFQADWLVFRSKK